MSATLLINFIAPLNPLNVYNLSILFPRCLYASNLDSVFLISSSCNSLGDASLRCGGQGHSCDTVDDILTFFIDPASALERKENI